MSVDNLTRLDESLQMDIRDDHLKIEKQGSNVQSTNGDDEIKAIDHYV